MTDTDTTTPRPDPDPATYTEQEISAAVNRAADDILHAVDAPDDGCAMR